MWCYFSLFLFFFSLGRATGLKEVHKASSLEIENSRNSTTLGLSPSNLYINGIAFGALPAFKEPIEPNEPKDINSKLSKPMAILGDYIKLDTNAEGLRNIDWHLETIQKLPGNPVYQIALMPNHGLKSLSKLVINRIAAKMEEINQKNVTVWLRFGHEMNGQWYSWGLKPNLFKKKWIHLTLAIRKRAPNTYMMWAPNARFGKSVNSVKGGYSPYWPGSQYVDIAALSYYHFGGPSRLNIVPAQNEAIEKLKEFSKLYGYRGKGKPIVLAETSAPFTRSLFGKVPERGGGSEEEIKISWLSQLFSGKMHGEVPELKAISWFEVKKNEKAPDGRYRKSEDFRLLLGKEEVSQEASSYLAGDRQAD